VLSSVKNIQRGCHPLKAPFNKNILIHRRDVTSSAGLVVTHMQRFCLCLSPAACFSLSLVTGKIRTSHPSSSRLSSRRKDRNPSIPRPWRLCRNAAPEKRRYLAMIKQLLAVLPALLHQTHVTHGKGGYPSIGLSRRMSLLWRGNGGQIRFHGYEPTPSPASPCPPSHGAGISSLKGT